jgi:hypothetical protein
LELQKNQPPSQFFWLWFESPMRYHAPPYRLAETAAHTLRACNLGAGE